MKKTVHRSLQAVLPSVLEEIAKAYDKNPLHMQKIWTDVIGKSLAPMTKIVSFKDAVLIVQVKNPTLYSVLCQQEKKKLLTKIQEKISKSAIREIVFRIGS